MQIGEFTKPVRLVSVVTVITLKIYEATVALRSKSPTPQLQLALYNVVSEGTKIIKLFILLRPKSTI